MPIELTVVHDSRRAAQPGTKILLAPEDVASLSSAPEEYSRKAGAFVVLWGSVPKRPWVLGDEEEDLPTFREIVVAESYETVQFLLVASTTNPRVLNADFHREWLDYLEAGLPLKNPVQNPPLVLKTPPLTPPL